MTNHSPPTRDTEGEPPQEPEPSTQETSETSTNSESILDRVIDLIKIAGTVGEENTTRDGAFSHKAETHAAGMGLAAGWYATTQGETQLLSLVYGAAVYGRNFESSGGQRSRLIKDIIAEPHYAIFFVVLGAFLGTLTNGAIHGIELIGDVPML